MKEEHEMRRIAINPPVKTKTKCGLEATIFQIAPDDLQDGIDGMVYTPVMGDIPKSWSDGGIIAVMAHGSVVTSDLDQSRLGGVAIDMDSLGRTLLMVYALAGLLLAPAGVIVWKALDVVERATKRNPAES
jgi:hypothetical protein